MEITTSLIRRCKNNEREAFDILLKRFEKQLYSLCYNYTRNKEETLDILQETYLKVFRSMKHFDETRPLFPWLKKIAVNTALNHKRDGKKHRCLSLDESDPEGEYSLLDTLHSSENVEENVLALDTEKLLLELIGQLTPTYRMALTLRYREIMSYEEIAATMNMPVGTIKNGVFRARGALRRQLEEHGVLEV